MSRTALITGASKRLGKAMATHLASEGWNIVIHYNSSASDAENLMTTLKNLYPHLEFHHIKGNLESQEEVQQIIPRVLNLTDRVDLLINNASIFVPGHLAETSRQKAEMIFNINFFAPLQLMNDFYNLCKKGNIINMVDTRITTNRSDHAAYTLSKKALWDLTKMATVEFSPNVRVNAIAPGATLPPAERDHKYLEKIAEKTPMKTPGGVLPVLQSLSYILDNEHLTGQLLFADGGENLI